MKKIIVVVVLVLFFILSYIFIFYNPFLSITLNGKNNYEIEVNSNYIDELYKAKLFNLDMNSKVIIDSNLNTSKIGNYKITYTIKFLKTVKRVSRYINVINGENIKQVFSIKNESGVTYINSILIVNKTYSLPSDYAPGINHTALYYLHMLQADAKAVGIDIPVISAYRSYETQRALFDSYYAKDGDKADTYSARPGHSEHQTGLAFDVGAIDDNYGDTIGGKWLYNNCANYGFIIRYLKGKEDITGYKYEPWHIRYVGSVAEYIMNQGITLEEYLNIA